LLTTLALLASCAVLLPFVAADEAAAGRKSTAPKSRSFLFTYGATITGLKPGEPARIWLPVASSSEDQEAKIESKDLPGEGKIGHEKQYGNDILYFEAKAGPEGTIPLSVTYRITRREVKADTSSMAEEDTGKLARFLQPDAKVPITGKPLDLLKDKDLPADQLAAARMMYDIVNNHMRYSKDKPGWGQGDAVWACDSKFGNCSDFHSLFISLARSQKIPAKFEIGFPIPEKRGAGDVAGYHCWAKFRPNGKGWVPVDISEANKNPAMKDYYFGNLTEDRVTFSVGRDLELVPKQDGPPVNFLIYPYVEVGGKPYDAAKIQKKFSYADVQANK
jgi:transglutaminase-like putative cysteine protease